MMRGRDAAPFAAARGYDAAWLTPLLSERAGRSTPPGLPAA
jgi:hypothetical protein